MKKILQRATVSFLLALGLTSGLSALASSIDFTENFNGMGTGTTPPAGWAILNQASGNPNDKTLWTASNPIIQTGVTMNQVTPLTLNDAPTATNVKGFNALGASGQAGDRCIATSPTGIASVGIQAPPVTNNTGSAISAINISYDIKRFTVGSVADELLGFWLFYSVDGGTTWYNVTALNPTVANVPNTVGLTTIAPTNIVLSAPWANGGTMLLRWVDDNGIPSPDQIIGLDNVHLTTADGSPAPLGVAIASPANGATFAFGAPIAIQAATSGVSAASVTDVVFRADGVMVGDDPTAPYDFSWNGASSGGHALDAIALLDNGSAVTSAAVNVTVNSPVNLPPAVTIIAPTNGATAVSLAPSLTVSVSDPESSSLTVAFHGRAVSNAAAGSDFALVALPDTQNYSTGYPLIFQSQTDWIVANRLNRNIAYVTGVGDIVNNAGSHAEYQNATGALYRLENPVTTGLSDGIPYGTSVGNHDLPTTLYNQYFGTNHFAGKSYYGGNYGSNNDSHFDLFSASGIDFVVLHITMGGGSDSSLMAWGNNVLQTYANRRAIVVEHSILNVTTRPTPSTWTGEGQPLFDALKGNTNVFLMLCGHMHGEGFRHEVLPDGRVIDILLADYQDYPPNGGDGNLRIMTFSPSNNQIRVTTYSTSTGVSRTGPDSQFNLDYTLSGPTAPFVALGTNTGVASGSQTSLVWPGLATSGTYEWYAIASDGVNSATGAVAGFTTRGDLPTTVSLTAPVDGSTYVLGQTVPLSATTTGDRPVTNVSFFVDGVWAASDVLAPYTASWTVAATGTHALTAVAWNNEGMAATSTPVTVTATTAVAAAPWKFGVMSDTQWTGVPADQVNNPNNVSVSIINQINPQFINAGVKFVVQVGDLTENGAPADVDVRAAAATNLYNAGIGFFPLRGNHESGATAARQVTNDFPQTQGLGANVHEAVNFTSASSALAGLSYAFDYRNTRMVLLDQFTRLDGSGSAVNDAMVDQVPWVGATLSNRLAGTHAFVFSHKNLIGENHVDCLFGANPSANTNAQNQFIGALAGAGVRYTLSGHDHVFQRSMIASPDGLSSVEEIICGSDSSKFYTPASTNSFAGQKFRETSMVQDLYRITYYVGTVDGPRFTMDYFASDETFPSGNSPAVTPTLHFNKRETFGYSLNGKRFLVPQGGMYTSVVDSVTSGTAYGETYKGTTARILAGVNGSTNKDYNGRGYTREISTGWAPSSLASDVLTLWGMADVATSLTDTYVLSMSYDPAAVTPEQIASGSFGLLCKDGSGNWVNAVTFNAGGTAQFVLGAWDSGDTLGAHGVDTNAHTVWAVVNHASDFAAGHVAPFLAPSLTGTPSGTVITNGNPTLSWTAVEGATGYTVALTLPGGSNVYFNTSGTGYTLPEQLLNGAYSWTVTPYNGDGNGPASGSASFMIVVKSQANLLGYVSGDFHQHTTYTDGSNPFATVMAKDNEYGLDWWANSEHGGKFNRNAAGPVLTSGYDTGTYAQYLDTLGLPFLGDSAGVSGGHTNMWRWQTLRDFSFVDLLAARSLYPSKTIVQGVEWNVPGHEHCSVGIIKDEFGPSATNAEAITQFEYLWDANDADLSLGAKNTTNTHAKALQAVAWMQANYPTNSWMVPAHPERRGVQAYPGSYSGSGSQGYSVAAFRDLNNAGPSVCFGFESMPGHQKAAGRGGYGTSASGGGTYGGCGYYAAKVGGLWDAMLGEGRGFWLFASSDFHTTVEDFWPGEYQKTYTRQNGNDPQSIVDGLRSGDSFVVEGDLIDAMDFTVNGAKMGSRLYATSTVVTVNVRVHDPEGANNCPTNLPAGINTPVLDHIDVIAGQFGGLIATNDPAYLSDSNVTTRVVGRFDAVGGATDSQGVTSTAWTDEGGGWKRMTLTYDTKGRKTYFRLRGSNLGLGVAGQTDAAGNPLLDPQDNTALKAWADLWFYSNPVFVQTPTVKVDANVYQSFNVGMTNGAWVYLEADPANASPLRATQRSLGYREVAYKAKMFSGLSFTQVAPSNTGTGVMYDYTAQKSKNTYTVGYWKDKDLPVMIGPDGNAYITDGHHTSAGYLSPVNTQSGDVVPGLHRVVLGHVVTNFYNAAVGPVAVNDTWWTARLAENNAFLYGIAGNQLAQPSDPGYAGLQPILPSTLAMPVTPSTLGSQAMTHDIYRGLMWGLADGILKTALNGSNKIKGFSKGNPFTPGKDINFVEFFWSDFLRNRVVWDDTKSGHALGSGFGDANAISAPISFFAAVANATALARSQDYHDQYGRSIYDYTNNAVFNPNTVTWASASLVNGLAVAGDIYNLFLMDDSMISGDISPSPLAVNTLHIDTTAGMVVSNRLVNIRDVVINAGGTMAISWKDASVANSTLTNAAGTGRVTLKGTNTVSGAVSLANGTLVVDGSLTAASMTVAPGATLEYTPGSAPITVTGNLALNGTLNITGSGFGVGTYTLFNCGSLSGSGLVLGSVSDASLRYTIDTNVAGRVQLHVASSALRIASLSDMHYFATNLLVNNGVAFQTYLAQDRKLLAESAAITKSAVDAVIAQNPDIVLVSGDLTKDGELESHVGFSNQLARLVANGAKVFVVPGNHDINNTNAAAYDGASTIPVANVTPDEFRAIYAPFGYGQAIARDTNSLSYIVEPVSNLWVVCMDSCQYTNGLNPTAGSFDAGRLAWITNELAIAKAQGKVVMGMMHHGLMEHYTGQKTLFSDYVLDGYTNVAPLFASYGMKAVFTGHYHAQDIVKGTFGGNDIYDIETGSTVTYPCPYRIMDLQPDGQLVINSFRITAIDYNLGGAPDFHTYAYNYLHTGMLQLSSWMLQAAPYGLSAPVANYLAPAVTEAMEYHYIGDEPGLGGASPATYGIVTNLLAGDAQSQMLGGAIWSILTDLPPADNSLTMNLSGVTLVSPADGALYTEGQTIVLEAVANWNVTNVDFIVNGIRVGNATSRPYTISVIAPTGTFSIAAVAWDNLGEARTSSTVNVTVRPRGPTVGIKVNGSHNPITVSTSQTVSVTIQLNVGHLGGQTADWFILAHDATRDTWYQYVNPYSTTSWRAPWLGGTSLQAPLVNVPNYEVLHLNGMAAGQYDFYFGIDMNRNGRMDFDTLYYDGASVIVTP